MKALHLTYRFGTEVVGGAEHYMRMLSRALVQLGVTVDLWTTRTESLPAISRFGVRWDNTIGVRRESVDGIRVRRYTTVNLPRAAVWLGDRVLAGRWRREEEALPEEAVSAPGGAWVGAGWHGPERHGSETMRWTGRRARIVIQDRGVQEVFFEARCPRRMRGRFEAEGGFGGPLEVAADWRRYRFPGTGTDGMRGEIILERSWRARSDPRRLGIAVRNLGYVAGGLEKLVDLDDDQRGRLRRDRRAWIARLMARAGDRPWLFEALFFLLRAPISPGLLFHLHRDIRKYDVVLAQMVPYSTLNYAVHFGRKHGVPVVLLPHFHSDDDFYHLRHYYHAFRAADLVLAFSDFQKELFSKIGARAEVVGGGGVDDREFAEGGQEAGREFRRRLGVDDEPLVLFVGRKCASKRYDLLIKAVDRLNDRLPCRLVMIGPDEDGEPITSRNVRWLGRQPRDVVVAAYRACDVFAMLSESESFGMVFLEAWMAKKPVVGNRGCTAVAELIDEGRDGLLCDGEGECAERIAELLRDRDRARRMGERGFEKVMREFTWDAIARKVAGFYGTVAGRGRGRDGE
jgi:glycosyltransferase involved in cell wall biosynthesis